LSDFFNYLFKSHHCVALLLQFGVPFLGCFQRYRYDTGLFAKSGLQGLVQPNPVYGGASYGPCLRYRYATGLFAQITNA
jgi:hypothetical protein